MLTVKPSKLPSPAYWLALQSFKHTSLKYERALLSSNNGRDTEGIRDDDDSPLTGMGSLTCTLYSRVYSSDITDQKWLINDGRTLYYKQLYSGCGKEI